MQLTHKCRPCKVLAFSMKVANVAIVSKLAYLTLI